jgi:hypothetical protein
LLLALTLAASPALFADAVICGDSTIQGRYAFTLHGTIFLQNGATLLIYGIALQRVDGKGSVLKSTLWPATVPSRQAGAPGSVVTL